MDKDIRDKRGLIVILVIASGVVFIGLVWIIATYFPWTQLGVSESEDITQTPRVDVNCTYPISYWKEHGDLYPAQVILGSQVYKANDIQKALSNADQGLVGQLQAQLVGAFLNTSAGANQEIVETTIFQAYKWLVEHPDESQIADGDREAGSRYLSILEAYNLGLAGVPLCEGVFLPTSLLTALPSSTPTLLLTDTPSQTTTNTPSETPSATQSETSSPTSQSVIPIFTMANPSRTPIPTTEPPSGQSPTLTQMPPPAPTNTPFPPTPVPAPTNTPPVPTFTLPPLPTATFTLPPPP
jgi:hypothetical protein